MDEFILRDFPENIENFKSRKFTQVAVPSNNYVYSFFTGQ